ncbi:hypothetical protein [Rhodoplanes roseus]|nr:hypothetical protein [Rhodoplanes roseus]
MKTFYVVQGFTAGPRGRLSPVPAIEVPSAEAALRRAEKIASINGGAIAFSRAGDPGTDDFDDPVVLARFGQVPEEVG